MTIRQSLATAAALLLCALAFTLKPARDAEVDRLFEKLTFTRGSAALPYRMLKPDRYGKAGQERYPLVIFLHGLAERGTDNQKQLCNGVEAFAGDAARKNHPCFLMVPQCPPDGLWCRITAAADTRRNLPLAQNPTEPAALVLELIDAVCRDYRVDTDRIYLTGVSLGGYGTWDLIARRPELFAAAMPVCGGGDPAQAGKLAHMPVWAFHGDHDPLVPVERSRDMITALQKAGGKPNYTEYKDANHDSWTPTYKNPDVLEWLFRQRKESTSQ